MKFSRKIFDHVTPVPKSQGLIFFIEYRLIYQRFINVEPYCVITVPSQSVRGFVNLVYYKLVIMLRCSDYDSAENGDKNGDKKLVTKN